MVRFPYGNLVGFIGAERFWTGESGIEWMKAQALDVSRVVELRAGRHISTMGFANASDSAGVKICMICRARPIEVIE